MDTDRFFALIAEALEVDVRELGMETAYGAIEQWDSLMHLRLIALIEDECSAEIPIDAVPEIKTLGDLYRYAGEA